ncbi:hypothetical protein BSL78_10775 [Apostichopus japonicus]|uniref:Transposase domain-containing protein n=1 Tax=Stichopus japonicus TaxID=307972 RepID=A0A2G8KWF6_STIJA|nr:hypothetical protein BSL78_10775 [Apostichopus japonicus]
MTSSKKKRWLLNKTMTLLVNQWFFLEDSDLKLNMMRVDDVDMADEWFDTFSGEELEFQQEALFDCSNSTADLDPTFKENEPIFKGAPITLAESMLLILLFATRHSLTGEGLVDLLTLVSMHCLKPNICTTSLYMFNKFFGQLKSPMKIHKFCKFCMYLLSSESKSVEMCPVCSKDISQDLQLSYFIEIPIIQQIGTLFAKIGFYNDLQHRFQRKKQKTDNVEDIYDGYQYKKLFKPGQFLYGQNNISLMWYTDGCPLFKSSKVSLWPLFFAINELPYKKRFLKENMIYAGLWVGEKPAMATFLKPFHKSLMQLKEGVSFKVPAQKQPITVKAMVLCGTCDLPARCVILNMTQFNGAHGCTHCLQKGVSASTGRGSTWTYPFKMNNPSGPKRTHEGMVNDAFQAYSGDNKQRPVNGIKV